VTEKIKRAVESARAWLRRRSKAIGAAVGAGVAIGAAYGLDLAPLGELVLVVLGATGATYAAPANAPPAIDPDRLF